MLKDYLPIPAQAALIELKDLKARLDSDESGASLVEYSVLIGIITVGAIASVIFVGGWVAARWAALQAALATAP